MQVNTPRLKRLPQGVEHRGSKLRRFVKEENTSVGERGGTGGERPRPTADQRRHGDAVMGGL